MLSDSLPESPQTDWEITANRYVAFFDIMGFKDRVARSTHEEIYEMMGAIDDFVKQNQSIQWGDAEEILVRSTFFSDSILLYSKDDSLDSVTSLIATASALASDLLSNSIPYKGAIAFGKMSLDFNKSIIFGQPLIDAYLLQEEISFYAIILHASAESEIQKRGHDVAYLIFDYLCPFKAGASTHKTVPPIYADIKSKDPEIIEKSEEFYKGVAKLRLHTSGHLRRYIDYTNAYLLAVKQNF